MPNMSAEGTMPIMTTDGSSVVPLTVPLTVSSSSGYQDYSHGGGTVVAGSERMNSGMGPGSDLNAVGNVASGMMPGSTNGSTENGAASQGQPMEASFLKDSAS